MPLGYDQLKKDFEEAKAEKDAAEAAEAEKDQPTETSVGDEDEAA